VKTRATYLLLHEHEKALIYCTSVEKPSSALCTVETRVTYPLLHEREKAIFRTAHGGDKGDLPPISRG
jgi:hypothetical protein